MLHTTTLLVLGYINSEVHKYWWYLVGYDHKYTLPDLGEQVLYQIMR